MRNEESGLAAVMAAAAGAANAASTAAAPSGANAVNASPADLARAFPEAVAQIRGDARAEGVLAERDRIIGIEKIAVPGHEALVAEMKGDSSVTVEAAGLRLLGAERAVRESQMQGIKDVEKATGNVKSAPASDRQEPAKEAATTPDGLKAEFAASEALQAEFGTEAAYVAYKTAEAGGRIKVLGK